MSKDKKQEPIPVTEELDEAQLEAVVGGRRVDFTVGHVTSVKFPKFSDTSSTDKTNE